MQRTSNDSRFLGFSPVFDSNSRVLILGSFPSVKSREEGFYYGHPQNRFWKVISAVLSEPCPVTIAEKREMLLKNRIAIWDVCSSCAVTGSADSSIREVIPNDLSTVLNTAGIGLIFTNGKKADSLCRRYMKNIAIPVRCLPSTSPANAAWTLDKLIKEWNIITTEVHHDFY